MPIVVTVFPTQPAVELKQVHLRELKITLTDDNVSKASVRIAFSLFGRDAEGVKHLDREVRNVVVDDAFTEAGIKAAAGKPQLAQALAAIEGAIAAILDEQGTFGDVQQTA